MQFRRLAAVGTAILAMAGFGCSKTQDTSPESRLFGSPPAITGVDVSVSPEAVDCDVSDVIRGYFCTSNANPFGLVTFEAPEVHVSGSYSRVTFSVRASDPDSQGTTNDILLTSASYTTPPGQGEPKEVSLVLLDDGGTNEFVFKQVSTYSVSEDCDINTTTGMCGCRGAEYKLKSNDMTAGDGSYSRTFAFIAPGSGFPAQFGADLLQNCIIRTNNEAPSAGAGFIEQPLEFKIEAVDRSGNLAAWPVKPAVNIDATSYVCTGDACACCLMDHADPGPCKNLPGSYGPPGSGFENGACVDLF